MPDKPRTAIDGQLTPELSGYSTNASLAELADVVSDPEALAAIEAKALDAPLVAEVGLPQASSWETATDVNDLGDVTALNIAERYKDASEPGHDAPNTDQLTDNGVEIRPDDPRVEHRAGNEREQLSLAEVATQSEALDRGWEEVNRLLVEGPNGEFKDTDTDMHPLIAIANQVMDELGEHNESSVRDIYLGVRSRLREADPELSTAVEPHLDEALKIDSEIRALEDQYGEAMTAHREAAINRIASSVDWDRIISVFVADDWPPEASATKDEMFGRMDSLASSGSSSELHHAYTEALNADEIFNFAQSIEGVLDESVPKPDNGWFTHLDLVGAIKHWKETTEATIDYSDGRRASQFKTLYYRVDLDLESILSVAWHLRLVGDNNTAVLSPIVDACSRYAINIFNQFDSHADAISEADARARPNALYIAAEHWDTLERNAGITDVPSWVTERLGRFGPRLGSGIGFIRFTDEDKSSHGMGDDEDIFVAGERKATENTLYVDVHNDTYAYYQRKGPAYIHEMLCKEVERTFDHEVAHHIHGAILTPAELREWEKAVAAEPDQDADMGDHMRWLIAEGAPERRLRVERFAIRTSLYMNDPLEMALKYPRCFSVLNDIIGKHDGELISRYVEPIRELQSRGEDGEATRQLLLRRDIWPDISRINIGNPYPGEFTPTSKRNSEVAEDSGTSS